MHFKILLCQLTGQLRRFVSRDGAGHSENNLFPFAHRLGVCAIGAQSTAGGCARVGRIFSASTIDCIRRKSSAMLVLISR